LVQDQLPLQAPFQGRFWKRELSKKYAEASVWMSLHPLMRRAVRGVRLESEPRQLAIQFESHLDPGRAQRFPRPRSADSDTALAQFILGHAHIHAADLMRS